MSSTASLTKGQPGTEGQAYGEDESYSVDALAGQDIENRGSLHIAPRVVEKVAAAAAVEVEHVTGVPRRILGQTVGKVKSDSQARADAKIDGSTVSVSLTVAVEYPTPVRSVAAAVRANVVKQVGALCGLSVVQVNVDVPHFYSSAAQQSTRRVQ
ncbi:MAG: hypothetical protein QOG60_2540 [Frankiaceae bacterium]|jgi:uncharacterized alkaline shock family protein YloU|nr:hypothetical protein [Frankiaceae bacterium]MDQ1674302.1 hypothetical protein [Frankiaceae bacterium]